jgi:hypothetical protein
MVAQCCGILICSRSDHTYNIYLPASAAAAVNSASVKLIVYVSWNFNLYKTVPPASVRLIPDTDLLCVVLPALSESAVPISIFLSFCCLV